MKSNHNVSANNLTAAMQVLIVLLIFLMTGCSSEKTKIIRHGTGPNLKINNYETGDNKLVRFETFKKLGLNRDLFNYMYFQGDTLGFYIISNNSIKKAEAYFINPLDNSSTAAERIDVSDKKIFGFILVGSLMENFYRDTLDRPVSKGAFCCREIRYKIKIVITGINDRTEFEISDYFKIEYFN